MGCIKRAAAPSAALSIVMVLVLLPAGTASARRPHPPGGSTPPRAGTGLFAGISAWGEGATACARVEGPTLLRFFCNGIRRNLIGSYVLIRFPNKNCNALVQRGPEDALRGIQWTEQGTFSTLRPSFSVGELCREKEFGHER